MESAVEILMALALGVALAAAAGLRVFVPLLVVSLAAYFDYLPNWRHHSNGSRRCRPWLTFGAAAAVEIAAYYVPGLDHLLDLVMTPLALVAGVVLMAVPLGDLPPLLRWSVALIAGGGAAGITQAASTLVRAKSAAAPPAGSAIPWWPRASSVDPCILSAVALLFPVAWRCCWSCSWWCGSSLVLRRTGCAQGEAAMIRAQSMDLAPLRAMLPEHCLLTEAEDTRPFECDGLTLIRQRPPVVALPETHASSWWRC